MSVDFGKTSVDYAQNRAGFPEAFFDRLAPFGVGRPGQRVVDLGTGTGTVARSLAQRGCQVTGLDKSPPQLEQARLLDARAQVTVEYLARPAEETGLPAASFEVVTAGQCWHWFDRPRAAREVRRLLVSSGVLVIAHLDWLPLEGNLVEATEQLIQAHNPPWNLRGGTGLYPAWLTDVALAGFENIETFSFDLSIPYTQQAWRGRVRASSGVGASLPPEGVARFDTELAALMAERFSEDPLLVPHRVWAVVCRAPARDG